VPADELLASLPRIVGDDGLIRAEAVSEDLTHDEGLASVPVRPIGVAFPRTTAEVAEIVSLARQERVPLTARGGATGLSGGCVPVPGGLVVSFTRMNAVLGVDLENHVAVVQPGVTLDDLEKALRPHGLMYPVRPGEQSATLGGNVATNAGGMRAVRYGVTRQNVLGLEAVLGTGETIRAGGRFVKSSSGYDLAQLIIGSEGTLALVTEVTLKVHPVLPASATVLAPFPALSDVTSAVPEILRRGLNPTVLEYVDTLTMQVITTNEKVDLGIPVEVKEAASAYLVTVIDQPTQSRLDEDLEVLAELLGKHAAIDVYVLPPQAASALVSARERAFYASKAAGANEIIDVVVPRARIGDYLEAVGKLAAEHGSFAAGCGHAGDGNVHLAVFQPDHEALEAFLEALFEAGLGLGGAISGEHGIGTAKRHAYTTLEQPERIALMRRIKAAFDPDGILNPDKIFDPAEELA
jgi:glycolate oxidase